MRARERIYMYTPRAMFTGEDEGLVGRGLLTARERERESDLGPNGKGERLNCQENCLWRNFVCASREEWV